MRFHLGWYLVVLGALLFPALQSLAVDINIVIDGDFGDWADVPVLIEDPDDIGEDNGDIKEIRVYSTVDTLYAMITVYGTAAPPPPDNQRYYYHLLIDADNNIKTGYNNSVYEGNDTGVKTPIGADFYAQIGRRDGADDGIEVYFLTADDAQMIGEGFPWAASGDSIEMAIPFEMLQPLDNLGNIFGLEQVIKIAAFQEGSANGWEVDWTESAEHVIGLPLAVEPGGKLAITWGSLK